ncbi:MAG: tRNA lysidine(34) synthetase TilS [Candidatus Poribacteria bacterium]|nr:tRNA lysidine(34) synthetase TilS [Candidatus Poribacteria bacterium]MDE0505528.1 tRNA lysidine(34) synthetase TilS [Candidatus Poribacteria bacterium]
MSISSGFLQRAHRFILRHDMICSGETVVIGFSGGVDSLALLIALHELRHHFDCKLHVAHLDHQLRQESAFDAQLVKQHASRLKLPFTIKKVDIPALLKQRKQSKEAVAREVRYKFFESVCSQTGATKVALGHHRDDQAETVLINLLRGAAITGLRGILPVRDGKFIRPLLHFSRLEIDEFVAKQGLRPCEDSTNWNRSFLRNRIRLELIPLLKRDYNHNIQNTLAQNAELVREESDYLEEETCKAFNACLAGSPTHDVVALDRLKFLRQHRAMRRRILRLAVEQIQGDAKDLAFNHSESMLQLCEVESPNRRLNLPNNLEFLRAYNQLIIQRPSSKIDNFEYTVAASGTNHFPALNTVMTSTIVEVSNGRDFQIPSGRFQALFDADEIQMPLKIRNRQSGDRIQPFGMAGTKKVKDLLIDAKVPQLTRQGIPILVAGNEVLWVVGYRTSEKYKVKDKTRRILRLNYSPKS